MTDRELLVSIHQQIEAHFDPGDYRMRVNPRATDTPKGNFSGWVWPVPAWNGEQPVISDGFNRYAVGEPGDDDYQRQHLGVDVMFKNDRARYPNPPELSKWFHMPSDTVPMLAAGAGHIWFAGKTGTGWTVKIDHHAWAGFPLISYCTHMSKLFIDDWDDKPEGLYVPAGFELGVIGPAGDLNHCHFELWDYSDGVEPGRVNRALDPEPYLKCFGHRVLPA